MRADSRGGADAFTHRLKNILRPLVHADHVVAAQEKRHRIGAEPIVAAAVHMVEHHELLRLERFELGARLAMQHIFQRQRVQAKSLAQGLELLARGLALQMQPGDFRSLWCRCLAVGQCDRALLGQQPLSAVAQQADAGRRSVRGHGGGAALQRPGDGARAPVAKVLPLPTQPGKPCAIFGFHGAESYHSAQGPVRCRRARTSSAARPITTISASASHSRWCACRARPSTCCAPRPKR